jgi:hypothetical protein
MCAFADDATLRIMADDERRIIIDRANRLVRQSKALRKVADDLLKESDDIRTAVKGRSPKKRKRSRR